MARIEVLIVDDHAIVRDGLRLVLGDDPELSVCGEASDGEQAASLASALSPHVVLLDMRMAGLGGGAAIGRVCASCPTARVLVLSMNEDARHVRSALSAGAAGYVAKRSSSATLVSAIKAVARGERFVDPNLPERVDAGPAQALSAREQEVAELLAGGHSGPEIARTLGVSKSSVDTYRARIFNKLAVQTLAELIERLRRGETLSSESDVS
ncbi:MAG: response regulator transcription factor [Myxococcales bacterium]|nr:response regulator transcription factor [Myxococcales bacterium]MDD9969080.1 response regulator transcription factor [Myxococcales bacterium]